MYASTATLLPAPAFWGEEAVLTFWTALLNCNSAKGHYSAHAAK